MLIIILILSLTDVANFYLNSGNLELAYNYYKTAINLDGENEETMLKFGQTCYLLGKYDEASRILSKVHTAEAKRWLGFNYFQTDNFREAVWAFQDIALDPVARYHYAIALFEIGDYSFSLDILNDLKDEFPKDEIRFWRSVILARIDQKSEALQHLNQIEKYGWREDIIKYLDSYLRDQLNMPLVFKEGNQVLLLRARKEYYDGNIKNAIAILDSISEYKEYRNIGLALCYLRLNWYNKSIEAVSTLPDTAWIANYVYLIQGEAYLNLRNFKAAKENFRKIGHQGIKGLIWTSFKIGEYDSTLFYIKKLEESYPESYDNDIRYLKAQTLFNLKMYPEVKHICQEIIDIDPESNFAQQAFMLMAEADLSRGNPKSARMIWHEFVHYYPASSLAGLAMKRIGDSYYTEGNYFAAIENYMQIKNFSYTPSIIDDARLKMEIARYKLGNYKSYTTALIRYVNNYPDSPTAPRISLEIGDRYKKSGKLKTALKWYEKVRNLYPARKKQALIRIAKIKEISNDIEGLKETYHAIVSIGENPTATEQLARLYMTAENYDSAIYWFERLSKIENHRNLAYYELAKVYRKIDRNKEAEFFLRPITEAESPYRTDATLELAGLLQETGRFEEAKRVVSKLINNPNSHLILGEIEFLSGNYLKAKAEFIKACSLFGDNRNSCAEAIILAGDASLKAGDKESASQLYDRAEMLALDPRIKIKATRRKDKIE